MKKLLFAGQEYEAERIIKNVDSLIGYSSNVIVFEFRGVTDFSFFRLEGGAGFDTEPTQDDFLLDMELRVTMLELGL